VRPEYDGRVAATSELNVRAELRSLDPATLELVGTVPLTAPEEMAGIVAAAAGAQAAWARSGPAERRALLRRLRVLLLERMDEIARTVTRETGKPLLESYSAEVLVAADTLRWLERNAERVLRDERVRMPLYVPYKRGRVVNEPLGVVAVIAPWNFPFAIPFTQTVAALAAGNAVVLKPSELAPVSGALIEELVAAAGAPAGLVRVVQGDGEVGAALVSAPGVARVFFTGSAAVGRRVARAAAELLRPVTLELGGKDAMLVLDDADLERSVEGALWSSFTNCGQICSGVERLYVAAPLYEPFVERLASRARSLRIGRGDDAATELGPLISESARERVEALVADALDHGAEAVCGARRPEVGLPGWFYEPTVLVGGVRGRRVALEEIFGPVVTVEAFDDDDEAVRLANGTPFGLGASVWSRDPARARSVAARLEAGSVWTNDSAYSYALGAAPWGGVKSSGFGRSHGRRGLLDCTQARYADEDRGRLRAAWWYPYDEQGVEGFAALARTFYGGGAAAAWHGRRGLAALARRALGR
jgi:succinate-semialdehyde dehydrogenase/glutarate-semialdehyde dehydrogenase